MTETAAPIPSEIAEELEAESHAPYIQVWGALAVLTGLEYIYAFLFKDYFALLILGLVVLALVKAGLVGWYFMHLKFEKPWVYILIVPAGVMAVFLTLMLYPDMAMKPADFDELDEQVWTEPTPDSKPPIPVVRLEVRPGSAPHQLLDFASFQTSGKWMARPHSASSLSPTGSIALDHS
jgi:cytochrome c oxidase subunit 4